MIGRKGISMDIKESSVMVSQVMKIQEIYTIMINILKISILFGKCRKQIEIKKRL